MSDKPMDINGLRLHIAAVAPAASYAVTALLGRLAELEAERIAYVQRIGDLKFALGDNAGWFDRFRAERDRAEVAAKRIAELEAERDRYLASRDDTAAAVDVQARRAEKAEAELVAERGRRETLQLRIADRTAELEAERGQLEKWKAEALLWLDETKDMAALADKRQLELVAERRRVEALRDRVTELETGIRKHREASGHNLCWYVPELWSLLSDQATPSPDVPATAEFLRRCEAYRRSLDDIEADRALAPQEPEEKP